MPRKIKILIAICIVFNLLLVVCIVNFLLIPEVIRCEILTAKYGHEFEDPELFKDAQWIANRNIKLKVLEYDRNRALIYYTYDVPQEDSSLVFYIYGAPDEEHIEYSYNCVYRASAKAVYCRQANCEWKLSKDVATPQGKNVKPYWWHKVNGTNEFVWEDPYMWYDILLPVAVVIYEISDVFDIEWNELNLPFLSNFKIIK